jgi:hypothetical protein
MEKLSDSAKDLIANLVKQWIVLEEKSKPSKAKADPDLPQWWLDSQALTAVQMKCKGAYEVVSLLSSAGQFSDPEFIGSVFEELMDQEIAARDKQRELLLSVSPTNG